MTTAIIQKSYFNVVYKAPASRFYLLYQLVVAFYFYNSQCFFYINLYNQIKHNIKPSPLYGFSSKVFFY